MPYVALAAVVNVIAQNPIANPLVTVPTEEEDVRAGGRRPSSRRARLCTTDGAPPSSSTTRSRRPRVVRTGWRGSAGARPGRQGRVAKRATRTGSDQEPKQDTGGESTPFASSGARSWRGPGRSAGTPPRWAGGTRRAGCGSRGAVSSVVPNQAPKAVVSTSMAQTHLSHPRRGATWRGARRGGTRRRDECGERSRTGCREGRSGPLGHRRGARRYRTMVTTQATAAAARVPRRRRVVRPSSIPAAVHVPAMPAVPKRDAEAC